MNSFDGQIGRANKRKVTAWILAPIVIATGLADATLFSGSIDHILVDAYVAMGTFTIFSLVAVKNLAFCL